MHHNILKKMESANLKSELTTIYNPAF